MALLFSCFSIAKVKQKDCKLLHQATLWPNGMGFRQWHVQQSFQYWQNLPIFPGFKSFILWEIRKSPQKKFTLNVSTLWKAPFSRNGPLKIWFWWFQKMAYREKKSLREPPLNPLKTFFFPNLPALAIEQSTKIAMQTKPKITANKFNFILMPLTNDSLEKKSLFEKLSQSKRNSIWEMLTKLYELINCWID